MLSCGQSEKSNSREERVMKNDFGTKSCGPHWMFGYNFGALTWTPS
jgi:hypothetical protein